MHAVGNLTSWAESRAQGLQSPIVFVPPSEFHRSTDSGTVRTETISLASSGWQVYMIRSDLRERLSQNHSSASVFKYSRRGRRTANHHGAVLSTARVPSRWKKKKKQEAPVTYTRSRARIAPRPLSCHRPQFGSASASLTRVKNSSDQIPSVHRNICINAGTHY